MAIQNIVGEWLMRKGKKIAPKTFLQQILLPNGSKFEDEYNENKSNVEARLGDIDTTIGEIKPDWNENDPSSPSYISNRICYVKEEYERKPLVSKVTVTTPLPNSPFGPATKVPPIKEELITGETYFVTFDDVDYECICKESIGTKFPNYIGNGSLNNVDSENTNEPFAIWFNTFPVFNLIVKTSTDGEHTILISRKVEIISRLDDKFLSENMQSKTGESVSFKTFTYNLDGEEHTAVAEKGAEVFNQYYDEKIGGNIAVGRYSHAEGSSTKAIGECSHAEGSYTKAIGYGSHAEGNQNIAKGEHSHAEGQGTKANGERSHAEGGYTITTAKASHAEGKYNIEDTEGKYAHIVGNGDYSARSNAYTLDWEGNGWYQGSVESSSAILRSSTPESTKKFNMSVDDEGKVKIEGIGDASKNSTVPTMSEGLGTAGQVATSDGHGGIRWVDLTNVKEVAY